MKRLQIAVLARAPVPGQAKTRLVPRLGAVGAARLQAALTRRALRRACALPGAAVALWVAGPIDHPFITACQRDFPIEVRAQPAADLGARMLVAIAHGATSGAATMVIGTDCPAQTVDDLAAAHAALTDHDLVVQPAYDGGYVLIGMHEPVPEIFRDIVWGSSRVLETTRERGRACSLSLAELRTLPDLDHAEDLDRALAAGWIDAEDIV
jgi:rSAM/selenodomain-associated transferase 1